MSSKHFSKITRKERYAYNFTEARFRAILYEEECGIERSASLNTVNMTQGVSMKAVWNNTVLAESNDGIVIEGNYYFPPTAVKREYFQDSATHTTCPWKGEASYLTVAVDGQQNTDAA